MNKPLRMGHQTEHITLLVADAGNIDHRAIGVGRIRPLSRAGLLVIFSSADPVGQCNLTVLTQPVNHVRIAENEASFTMSHRCPQVPRARFAMLSGAIEKSALIRLDTQMDPAILKLPGDVLYQGSGLVPLPPRKNAETNQDLAFSGPAVSCIQATAGAVEMPRPGNRWAKCQQVWARARRTDRRT